MPYKQQSSVATTFKHVKCADCNASDPTWASINRGVLICEECCQIHRTLGRHISDISSLQHGNWAPTRIQMLQNLVQNGANNIWEHELHNTYKNPTNPPKPGPNEKIRPNKENFIIAKYRDGKFCQRMEEVNTDSLNSQLLLAAAQNSLEITLRLLVMGARVNCTDDSLNTPVHIAAANNQILQYELLTIYGANPNTINKDNQTPYLLARKCEHYTAANRILALQYELTDRLIYFINNKQPDHQNGQHIIIPQLERGGMHVIEAKNKLKMLDNQSFEELAADLYDEVDRRETDQVWRAMKSNTLDVRFLPTNPSFSSLRNQGRQKLGTLSAKDIAVLVAHTLEEGTRREQISRPVTNYSYGSNDDEPSYCEVPSEYSDNEPVYDEGLVQDEGHSSPVYDQVPDRDEYIDNKMMVNAKLEAQQRTIKFLFDDNDKLKIKVTRLELQNIKLERENGELRSRYQALLRQSNDYDMPHSSGGSTASDHVHQPLGNNKSHAELRKSVSNRSSRHQALPTIDAVSEKTQHITEAVTMLRDAIRQNNPALFPEVYRHILQASNGVISVFPENPQWQTVKLSLELLKRSSVELSQLSLSSFIDRKEFIDRHINLAKDIARATKSLMGYVENSMK